MAQKLSKEQADIAFYNDCEGALLVQASAGSGKTRILTERVRDLLTKKKDKFFSVLCLTFTNKAAEEMRERLNDVPKLTDRAFIGNFHAFCLNQIIRKQRQEIGLKDIPHIFEKEEDRKRIIIDVLLQREDLKNKYEFNHISDFKDRTKNQQAFLSKCLHFISEAKRNLIVIPEYVTEWGKWNEQNTFLYKNYNYRLENQNAMDYDDILLYAYRILTERPAVANLYRRLYPYIMIDEAQDLNFAQYEILKAICGDQHNNIMMVGDPKQAIYAFTGANVAFMQKEFVHDFQATEKSIHKNYRSSTKVLKLAQHIRPNGGIPDNYFEGISEITAFDNEQEEAKSIIQQVKKWINKGVYSENGEELQIQLEDIAILARNRYIFKDVITLLETDEILKNNYHLRKGTEKFNPESQLVKVFDLGLRILINSSDLLHFNQLFGELGLESENTTTSRLEQLLSLNKKESLSEQQQIITNILVVAWAQLNKNPSLMDSTLDYIKKESIENLNFSKNDEEKLKIAYDVQEFRQLWKHFLRNTSSGNHNLANFRYFLALNNTDKNEKGLTLATVHTSKGLEYDIVFLMGMNEGVLPDYRVNNKQDLAEERNNAYVAITRAKKCIYISYPLNKTMPWGASKRQKISSFIKDYKK
jgi:DNA helicase-2/ATP-dependent DNA helicase PcrA